MQFNEAIAETRNGTRRLLIGNGFSIAQGGARFAYSNLLDHCGLAPDDDIRRVFVQLNTVDFEEVMKALEHAAVIEAAYGEQARSERFNTDAGRIREALIHAVHAVHPEIRFDIPANQQTACAEFLQKFSRIFSLNYDLLLYWVILHGVREQHSDGFGRGEEIDGFRRFSPSGHCSVFYLHGALHLFLDERNDTQKRVVTNHTIVDDITDTIRQSRKLPLFVAEGTASQKMRKINSVPYLRNSYEKLRTLDESLFIFGHSANEKDGHIYQAIGESGVGRIYYCVHRPAETLQQAREWFAVFSERYPGKQVQYVDAATANVWGQPA